jgi:hypothetical protein
MRSDIVPGAVPSGHELSEHRGKHRTPPELREGDPLALGSPLRFLCKGTGGQHEVLP